jgi:hypothetical protein
MNSTHHPSNEETFAEPLRLPIPEARATYLKELVACYEPRRRFCVMLLNCLWTE